MEAVLATTDARVLRGRAHGNAPVPYGPLRAALHGHGGLTLDAVDDAAEAGVRIRRCFEQLAEQCPTVVFLDDLQWADAATCAVLTPWRDPPPGLPLLIVGAYRREELRLGHPLRALRSELRRGVGGRERHVSLGPR